MDKETLKNLVKSYFQLEEKQISEDIKTEEITEQTFAEATLVDGTKVTNMVEGAFAVDQILHVILEDGTHVIAPEGEHTTESGITLVVDAEGKITGVHEPDSDGEGSLAEDEKVEMAEEEIIEEKTELAEDEEIIEEVLEEHGDDEVKRAIVEAIAEVVAPEIEALKAKLAEHEEKMKEYMSMPSEEPVKEAKAKFSATMTPKDKVWAKEPFNQKQAQYEMILKSKTSKTKTKTA